MRPRRIRKILFSALGLIILGTAWFYFAPTQLGGSTTYVVTHGTSMEPHFHTGDLAIVRSQSNYHVGEVVAYHNHQLHTIVLHRIVGREGDRYLFKGDNNNFVDPEHPVASQLIGALWIHIPGVGLRLQSIRSPLVMGILLFVGMLLLAGGAFARTQGRRRGQRHAGEGAATPTFAVLAIGALLAIPFLMLALLAFTRSPTRLHPYTVPYEQSGRLSYSAEAPPGPTYPGGRAVTGDPLFAHVLNAVDFSFAYRLRAVGRHSLRGRASLDATVVSTDGWHTTLELAPPTRFHGSRALVTGTLDLTSLLALVHSVETATKATGSYTLTLFPHVSATGRVNGLPVHTTFAPKIQFALSPIEAQPALACGDRRLPGRRTLRGKPVRPLGLRFGDGHALGAGSPSPSGSGRCRWRARGTLALYGIALVVLAVLAALACLRLALALGRSQPRDESASIRARYGRMIVPVARVWQLPGVPVIDVEDMEALAQIAEHYDRSILHEIAEDGEAFWVTDESGQFRYALGVWAAAEEDEPVEEFAGETLVHEAYAHEPHESYAHEPKLAGPISARGAPGAPGASPADDTFVADGVTQGEWTPRHDGGRGRKTRLV